MSKIARVRLNVAVLDETGQPLVQARFDNPPLQFVPGTPEGQWQPLSLAASVFTALTVPTGAKAVLLDLGQAVSLTLKGLTGDTGIVLCAATAPLGVPVVLPLGTAPSIGILNGLGSTQVIQALWL